MEPAKTTLKLISSFHPDHWEVSKDNLIVHMWPASFCFPLEGNKPNMNKEIRLALEVECQP